MLCPADSNTYKPEAKHGILLESVDIYLIGELAYLLWACLHWMFHWDHASMRQQEQNNWDTVTELNSNQQNNAGILSHARTQPDWRN